MSLPGNRGAAESADFYANYEEAKHYLICRLVNESNPVLEKVPSRRVLEDVAAAACIYRVDGEGLRKGYFVSDFWLNQWGVSEKELVQDSVRNMQRLFPARIERMDRLMESTASGSVRDVFLRLLKEKYPDTQKDVLEEAAAVLAHRMGKRFQEQSGIKPMWVLSNAQWFYGASSALYPGVLEGFADRVGGNFYILPSTVHELILLPEGGQGTRQLLYDMVAYANGKLADDPRFLSEYVYYYDWKKLEIQTF